MEDDFAAPDSVDLNGKVDMARKVDDEDEEDEEEEYEEDKEKEEEDEDEEEEDEDEEDEDEDEEEEEEEEKEEEDEDDGKEPRTIGQGEMVNPFADNVDAIVDHQPIVLPGRDQELSEHT